MVDLTNVYLESLMQFNIINLVSYYLQELKIGCVNQKPKDVDHGRLWRISPATKTKSNTLAREGTLFNFRPE